MARKTAASVDPLALVAELADIGSVDTVYRDLYLQRARTLMAGVMSLDEFRRTEQEQAASTLGAGAWQTFWRVTLPAIRWGVAYGVVLTTARVLGEFGAVTIVSGSISGETETLPLFVAKAFEQFNEEAAYAGAIVLALLALTTLLLMSIGGRKAKAGSSGPIPIAGDAAIATSTKEGS